jgi:hypothetical protein
MVWICEMRKGEKRKASEVRDKMRIKYKESREIRNDRKHA